MSGIESATKKLHLQSQEIPFLYIPCELTNIIFRTLENSDFSALASTCKDLRKFLPGYIAKYLTEASDLLCRRIYVYSQEYWVRKNEMIQNRFDRILPTASFRYVHCDSDDGEKSFLKIALPKLDTLFLSDFTDDDLSELEGYKKLKELKIVNSDITDDGLINFSQVCTNLKCLDFGYGMSQLTKKGCNALITKNKDLERLIVYEYGNKIDFSIIASLKKLEVLYLLQGNENYDQQILSIYFSKKMLATLAENCPNLKSVTFGVSRNLSSEDFENFFKKCSKLEEITIHGHFKGNYLKSLYNNCKNCKTLKLIEWNGRAQDIENLLSEFAAPKGPLEHLILAEMNLLFTDEWALSIGPKYNINFTLTSEYFLPPY